MVRSVPILAVISLLASPAFADDFSVADLEGRKAFRSVQGIGNRLTGPAFDAPDPVPAQWFGQGLADQVVELRGALEFDGEGGFQGFRLAWGQTMSTPSTNPDSRLTREDHLLTPLRQELAGTYTVSPDGVVAMTYTVTPVRRLTRTSNGGGTPGTQWVSATETAQAILRGAVASTASSHRPSRTSTRRTTWMVASWSAPT